MLAGMLKDVLQRFSSQRLDSAVIDPVFQGFQYYDPVEQVGPMEPFIGGFVNPQPSPSPVPPPIPPKDDLLVPPQPTDGLLDVGPHVSSQHPLHHPSYPPQSQLTIATDQLSLFTAVERSQMFQIARMDPHLQARFMFHDSHNIDSKHSSCVDRYSSRFFL